MSDFSVGNIDSKNKNKIKTSKVSDFYVGIVPTVRDIYVQSWDRKRLRASITNEEIFLRSEPY